MGMLYLAPMMGYTHGWFRSLIQALHPEVSVMTEMVTLQSLKYCPNHRALWLHPLEQHTAVQIATGSSQDVEAMLPYLADLPMTHINLNAGCPSAQVGQALMGASMMHHPQLTKDILSQLKTLDKKISLKTRLGVDDHTDAQWEAWLEHVLSSGIQDVFLHARIALLQGLNPAQNRSIPPLRYDRAQAIFQKYPHIQWVINGGIKTFEDTVYWLSQCDGVMLGRVSYQDPLLFYHLAKHEGKADIMRLRLWLDVVEDTPLTAPIITCLLALTKNLPHARTLRDTITSHKGKRMDCGKLFDAIVSML